MGEPSDAERVALGQAGPLLRFAAERVQDLDPQLPLAIATAQEAMEQRAWTAQTSQSFWTAFNHLCMQIAPATMESIAAKYENISTWQLFPIRKRNISLAARTSGRYLVLLFCLILVAMPLQLYAWVYSIESKKADELIDNLQKTATFVGELNLRLTGETKGLPPDKWGKAQVDDATRIVDQSEVWNTLLDRLAYHTHLLNSLALHGQEGAADVPKGEKESLSEMQWFAAYDKVFDRNQKDVPRAINAEATTGLIAGVLLAFVLPVLMGLIGAVTVVIRTMSDQIQSSTFSTTSPIRLLMRVTLGALAGVVVGLFSNLSSQLSLPPLALAFLAGYGVEALFSMFDGFIAKFRAS